MVSFFARKGSPRADLESGHRGYGTSGLLGVDVRVRTKVWKGEGYHINFMFGGKTQVSHKTRMVSFSVTMSMFWIGVALVPN